MNFDSYMLQEVCEFIDYRGKTPVKTKSGVPLVTAKIIKNGVIMKPQEFIAEDRYKEWMRRGIPKKGDVIFTTEAPLGEVAEIRTNEKLAFAQRIIIMEPKKEYLNNRYLLYALQDKKLKNRIVAKSSGTTVVGIKSAELKKIVIDLPSVEMQEKIADILYSLDEKIALNIAINDNLFEQMQSLYKAWFVDFLPFGGSKPRAWTQTDIYSLANIIYGAPFASKQFNTEGEGKPIIRIRDLKDQQFATYTTEVHPKGYLLQPGDIVVGMDGEFRPYIWGNDEAWLNQRVCVFENKRPSGKAFLYFTIKPLLYAIEQTQVATTVIHIGKKDYDAFEIALPDVSTLDGFDALTSSMVMQIVTNSFENKRLATMRDALLPKLMSGEIEVSSLDL